MIHWGILGLGKISQRFRESLAHSQNGRLYAVASYTESKRERFQEEDPDIKVYDDYDALLDDPDIDIVYIALRHIDHYEWSKKALLKGKAVLCEKPACLHAQQIRELVRIAKEKNIFYMEAMKTRFVPALARIHELLDEGIIGAIEEIKTSFCNEVSYDEHSYLFDARQGGALYDLAIYNIASIMDYIHEPLADIQCYTEKNGDIDVYDRIDLLFSSGQQAMIEVAIDRNKAKDLIIKGARGTIIASPFYRPTDIQVNLDEGETFSEIIPYQFDDFFTQIEEVHRCLQEGLIESPRLSHEDIIKNISLLARIKHLL